MWTYPGNTEIAHRHVNLEIGRAIPFLGIHKWDFRCSAYKQNTIMPDKQQRNYFLRCFLSAQHFQQKNAEQVSKMSTNVILR
jgi:hypothetical protein